MLIMVHSGGFVLNSNRLIVYQHITGKKSINSFDLKFSPFVLAVVSSGQCVSFMLMIN